MTSATIKTHDNRPCADLGTDPYLYLTKAFVYFLQSFFGHDDFIGSGMHWTDNEETTELIITAEKPRVESLEKVPHIVVALGQSNFAQLGMDQLQSLNMSTGARTHSDLVPVTIAYHCQAKEGLHARRLAWYSCTGTMMFKRLVCLISTVEIFVIPPF